MLVALATFLLASSCVSAYNNGIGEYPPMGWNTWCTDDLCGVIDKCTQSEIMSVADAIVAQGLDKLGYEYLVMDDCWSSTTRNATGHLQPEPSQFPLGFEYLTSYVHSKGLKIGLYTCIGTKTCHGGRPGSFGFYEVDAQTIANWGFDFVKTDNCAKPSGYTEQQLYSNFSDALNATGRPILFSLCEWGNSDVEAWGGDVGQMFRIQMDHLPFWEFPALGAGAGFGQGTADIIEYVATLKPSMYKQQWAHFDPDFLETLFPITMPFIESRTEYTFWAFWGAPLMVSTDIRNMSAELASIIANPEVIAIDQDQLFVSGDRIALPPTGGQVWLKELFNGDKAVILYNNGTQPVNIAVTWQDIGWSNTAAVAIRDLWKRSNVGVFTGGYNATIASHDVLLFRAQLNATIPLL